MRYINLHFTYLLTYLTSKVRNTTHVGPYRVEVPQRAKWIHRGTLSPALVMCSAICGKNSRYMYIGCADPAEIEETAIERV